MANTKKPLSVIVDSTNSVEYEIRAKQLESQIQVKLTGDTTGSATTDFSSDVSISTTIANKAVTEAKLADSAVTTGKINDKAVTLDKIADSARGGAVSDNDGVLATHSAVKKYVDAQIAGQGSYLGKQTVATINTWTAANLKNSDRVMCSDSGTITLGNISVRAGEDLIFWKNGETAIWQSMDGEFKLKQTAKSDPTASGTTITAIDSISQNTNGDITATKKTIRSATTSQTGVVQLSSATNSTSTTLAATASAVKAAYDRAGTLIAGLDVASVGGDGKYISAISETDGKISATATEMDTEPTENSKKAVTSGGIKTALNDLSTSLGLQISEFSSNLTAKLNGKTDLVENATAGNFAGLDANGNLTDSGKKASDFATASHAHGNITNAGAITATGVAIANGDALAIVDASNSSKVAKTSITFDGSTETQALTKKGTWATFNNYTHPTYAEKTAAAVKVGKDALGHVLIGDALTKADVGLDKVENQKITVTSASVSDGTNTFNKYVHPTTAGNKHIPAGGSSGQFLGYDSAGTAKWVDNPATNKEDQFTITYDSKNSALVFSKSFV